MEYGPGDSMKQNIPLESSLVVFKTFSGTESDTTSTVRDSVYKSLNSRLPASHMT